jgi:hypothetical protein
VARLHELGTQLHLRRHLLEQAPVWKLPHPRVQSCQGGVRKYFGSEGV